MERAVSAGGLHRYRSCDPADAGLAHAICRRQCRRLVPAGAVAGFRLANFAVCFVLIPAVVYLASFVPVYGLSIPDLWEAQRRIFRDNTTTAIAGHTYMSAWPSWPLLVRPVWYLFDKIGDDRSRPSCSSAIRWCCGRRCSRSRSACATGS